MDADTIPAGRELDALVAEKVMGLAYVRRVEGQAAWVTGRDWVDPGDYTYGEGKWGTLVLYRVPDFSTDIAAAWLVVERMAQSDRNLRLSLDRFGGDPWWCEFADEAYTIGAQAVADTAPLAICRAALAACRQP